jgi:hypothetical protein
MSVCELIYEPSFRNLTIANKCYFVLHLHVHVNLPCYFYLLNILNIKPQGISQFSEGSARLAVISLSRGYSQIGSGMRNGS